MRIVLRRWTFALLLLSSLLTAGLVRADVIITEFVASNQNGLVDENGDNSDWIELFNDGTAPVDLAGWHLTDDALEPGKWTFPSTTIEPRGFIVVFASG